MSAFLIVCLLGIPFVSAAVIGLFMRRHGDLAAAISLTSAGVTAALSLYLIFFDVRGSGQVPWLRFGEYTVYMGYHFNDMAALLLFVVAVVGFLIHIFSLTYMKDDGGKARYFAGLSLFMFSMNGIVVADNLIMVFIFWELVGLSSFVLISHYFHRPAAAAASKKAFIVNRLGDFGFLIGIIWSYWFYGTLNLVELQEIIEVNPGLLHPVIGLLLFCSALGKSGQIPLHVWLPDAMEGPTPVSALIHAATMVAAGIYLLSRIAFLMPVETLYLILWVGTVTALFGALSAIVQKDIKKILAYSTISQLGFMVAAFGLGSLTLSGAGEGAGAVVIQAGVGAALFHLSTHAFFKALLFLGAGSIIHACHHEQNIFRLGGLRKRMPLTFVTFTIGFLSLAGMPGLAGFFSKESILYLAFVQNTAVFWILVITSLITAFYMMRLWLITFFGEPKSDEAAHAKENDWRIGLPLGVLAFFSVFAGYSFLHPTAFEGVLSQIPHAPLGYFLYIAGLSVLVFVIGIAGAYFYYGVGAREDRMEKAMPGLFAFLAARFYFDDVYNWYVAKIQNRFASFLAFLDQILISGLIIRGTAGLIGLFSLGAKAAHVGNVHAYVYWFFFGIVLLWVFARGIL